MTGSGLLGLILLSMAWLFFLGGVAVNVRALHQALKARKGERAPSGLGFVPGVVGSLAAFFTVPALMRLGVEVPWPWLWIVLPLFLDPYCAGGFLLVAFERLRRR
jgi:hypothetical protein